MGWSSAVRKKQDKPIVHAVPETLEIDCSRLVTLDFETYFDDQYSLSKLSTSEYVRHEKFEALMCGISIGGAEPTIVLKPALKKTLNSIDWSTHSLLCHNTQFDGFILNHHYGIKPVMTYCTLSMARALFSNDIGGALDEVSRYLDGAGKLADGTEAFRGLTYAQLAADAPRLKHTIKYCLQDVKETLRIFYMMAEQMPASELDLIHLTNRMFIDPILRVDHERVLAEYNEEVAERKHLLLSAVPNHREHLDLLKTRIEKALSDEEQALVIAKRAIGSNPIFASLLEAEGIEPPMKISPTWNKKSPGLRGDVKYTFAFAKDDAEFIGLPDNVDILGKGLNLETRAGVEELARRQERLRTLVDARLAVKSTLNITRAERFMEACKNNWRLPIGYSYYRAHTGRWGGNNKMNMQNLRREGTLRLSILAPEKHVLCIVDSSQIEARTNAMLWDQKSLLEDFRNADNGTGTDPYCRFASLVYHPRTITKENKLERFVGKVGVLGLGFQMGPAKLQVTLAKGALGGPPVFFSREECVKMVNTYRQANFKIAAGWAACSNIIDDMAAGKSGEHGPITWESGRIWLPNGLALHYPALDCQFNNETGFDEWTYQSKDSRTKIYGGLLTENIVQALARIIVAEQMLAIDKIARVVMMTHDEVVAVAPAQEGEQVLAEMMKIMRTPPKWWPEIPLNAEGAFAENYSKK